MPGCGIHWSWVIHDNHSLIRVILADVFMVFFSPGVMPYHRLNFEFEMLKMEHKQVVSDQLKLPREVSKVVDKCNQLMEETKSVG